MRIFKYELIKIFRRKSILIALLIFSIINIYKINFSFKNNGIVNNEYTTGKEFNEGYWAAYDKSSGVINHSKIDFVKNGYKNAKSLVDTGSFSQEPNQANTYTGYIFGDMNMFKELYDALDYSYNYENRLDHAISKAKDNIEFYKKRGNDFEVKNNEKIIELYGGRSITEFYNTKAYEEFFKYDFSSLLIILLLILGLASQFSGEKEVGMDNMLSTSKYGKNATIFAKIIVSMLYVTIISVYFFVLDFICFSFIFKLLGYDLPLYAMTSFEFTPLNIKIWQFVICSNLIKLLGFLVIGALIILFSSLFSESLLPFVLSSGTITAYLVCNDFLSGKAQEVVALINPISLLTNREIFKKYTVVNIFGEPFLQFTATLIIMVLFFLLILFIVVIITKNQIFISKIKAISYVKKLRDEMLDV